VLIQRDGLIPVCWHAQWRETKKIFLSFICYERTLSCTILWVSQKSHKQCKHVLILTQSSWRLKPFSECNLNKL
jgi:hypothetical protein